ncbi:hypothetical protein ABPG74_022767 [Tetrahymena malaccensis]
MTDDKTGKILFVKKFKQKHEYEHEKKMYQELNQIQKEEDLKILQMLYHDDQNYKIFLPFINKKLIDMRFQQRQGKKRQKGMKQMSALYHFTQVAQTIQKLHGHKYCHCDIKPQNVVCELEKNVVIDYLIDFGHCQKKNRNETSTLACGTKQFNPHQLKLNEKHEFKEYSPYELDLYQLGMLLLNLIFYFSISNKNKLLIHEKKKDLFQEVITSKYKNNCQDQFDLVFIPEIYDLIWDLLAGNIKNAHEIFEHNVYQLDGAKDVMYHLQQIQNQDKKEWSEYLNVDYQQIIRVQEQNANRGNSHLNLKQQVEELMTSNCYDYEKFKQQYKDFCNKKPRKVNQSFTYSNSLLFEAQAPDVVQTLLYLLGNEDDDIFNQEIFLENENMILQVSTRYKFKDVVIEESDGDDDEQYNQKIIDEAKEVKMNIEIVIVEEKDNQDYRSIVFTNLNDKNEIEDESIYFYNFIQEIQEKLENL